MKNNVNRNINTLKITDLLCEYISEPLGIDTETPRFSWRVQNDCRNNYQTAYQILVSSVKENLTKNKGDMWDSGKIKSSQSVNIKYNGGKLKSDKTYYWKVKIWDSSYNQSIYSSISKFETGLLNQEDWKGEWLTTSRQFDTRVPIFRKEFTLNKNVIRARIYISGLGYYELTINGKKVGDNVLDPGWTDYSKRILYSTYNVEEFIRKGPNVLGVMLGNGWFVSPYGWEDLPGHHPQFILQMNIEYSDGTKESIVSKHDSDWLVSFGPIISNGIYSGEEYDARLEKPGWDTPEYNLSDDKEWFYPLTAEPPGGIMVSQTFEPIKVLKDIKPVNVKEPEKGIFVYDLGQNIAGWCRLKVKGPRGTEVKLKYAEILYENGKVNQENLIRAKATDIYILKGMDIEYYEPRFTYHGFRYIQVEGFPGKPDIDSITGKLVASSVERIGKFECSNELLNNIYNNIIWTLIDNRHSVPTDCPQRDERQGWLNDATTRAEGELYSFDMSRFYPKWLNDIRDAQGINTGSITETAPYIYGARIADPVCSSFVIIPWLIFLHYGDKRVLEENYESIKKWLNYLKSQSRNYILHFGHIGDWVPPKGEAILGSYGNNAISAKTPCEFIATGYYYYDALILSKMAEVLGKREESKKYFYLAKKIKNAFNKKYFNPKTGNYASGNQASNIFALFLDIVPMGYRQKVIENIIYDLEKHNYHLTTGNQCTKYLLEVLTDFGYQDISYKIATQKTYPSWGYMIENGATTIWERWELLTGAGMNSHNHPMLGSISPWFYRGLAGIDSAWNKDCKYLFNIKPHVVEDLKYVKASIKTLIGTVSSNWKLNNDRFLLEVEIPFNSSAKIFLPKLFSGSGNILIKESGEILWDKGTYVKSIEGINNCREETDYIVFEVGCGSYLFELLKK